MAEAVVIEPIEELSDSASRPHGSSFSVGDGSKLSRSERKKNRSKARRTFESYPDRDLKHQKRRGISPVIPRLVFSAGALGVGYALSTTGASGYETSNKISRFISNIIKGNKPIVKMAQFTSETFLPAFAHYAPLAILADAALSIPVTMAKKAYARTKVKLLLRLGGVADENFEKAVKMAKSSSLSSNISIFSAKSKYGEVLHEFYVKMPDAFTKKLLHGTSNNFGTLGFDLRKVPGGENLPDGEFSISAVYNAYKIIKAGYRGQKEEAQKLINAIKTAGIDPKYYAFLQDFVPTYDKGLIDFSKLFLDPAQQGGPFAELIKACIPDDIKRATYLAEMARDAQEIKQKQDLIGLCEGQIIDVRRRLKNNIKGFSVYNRISASALANYKSNKKRGNVKAIGMTNEQIARLTAATAQRYAEQVSNKISNNFVTPDWCIGVLNAEKKFGHPILNRRLARQQELVRQICNISGEPTSKKTFKKRVLQGTANDKIQFIQNNLGNIDAVRAGTNAGLYTKYKKLRECFIVTDKFKLKRGSKKQILKHTDEYKKASLKKNAFPIISKALGKFFWTTVAAAFTAIAIASGAGIVPIVVGSALTAFGITNKLVLEKKFGKFPYFTKKARAYREMRKQEKVNRYFANDTTYTSSRFRRKTLFNRRRGEFFAKYNKTVASKSNTTSQLLENVCEAYGVKQRSSLADHLAEANKAYELHVIANNANIQFTEHPIEIYITGKKGLLGKKVKQKLCFTSKDMLEKSLPGLLLSAGELKGAQIQVCCDGVKRDFYTEQIQTACKEIAGFTSATGVDNCNIIKQLRENLSSNNQSTVKASQNSVVLGISSTITSLTENEDVQRQYNGVFSRVNLAEYAQTGSDGIIADLDHVVPRSGSNNEEYEENLHKLQIIHDGKVQATKQPAGFSIDYSHGPKQVSRPVVPVGTSDDTDSHIVAPINTNRDLTPSHVTDADPLLDSPYDSPDEMREVSRIIEENKNKELQEELAASQERISELERRMAELEKEQNSEGSGDSDDKPVVAQEGEDRDKKLPVVSKKPYKLGKLARIVPQPSVQQPKTADGNTYNITINGDVNGVVNLGNDNNIVNRQTSSASVLDDTLKTFALVVAVSGMFKKKEEVGHPPITINQSKQDQTNPTEEVDNPPIIISPSGQDQTKPVAVSTKPNFDDQRKIDSPVYPLLLGYPQPKKQIDYIKLFTEKVIESVMDFYKIKTSIDFDAALKNDINFAKIVCNGIIDGKKSSTTVIGKIDFVETLKRGVSYRFDVKARPSKSNAKRYQSYATMLDSMPNQIIAGIIQSTKLTPSVDGCDKEFGFGDYKKAIIALAKTKQQ